MAGPALVELYAGMAAVTARAFGCDPPVPYKGGKRGYARQILALLGVDAPPSRALLVEADPYVAAGLRVVWTPELRQRAVEMFQAWADPDEAAQRARWEAWRVEAHATGWAGVDEVERGARWLWMRQRTVSQQPAPLCRAGDWKGRIKRANGYNEWRIDAPAIRTRGIAGSASVHHGVAGEIEPFDGAVVYLDPPYDGTSGYGTASGYAEAVELAERWAAAGSLVGVSSHIPLRLDAVPLAFRGARGRARTGTPEYLSIWRPHE